MRALSLIGNTRDANWVEFEVRRAQVLDHQRDFERAQATLDGALDVAKKLDDALALASVYRARGNIQAARGQFKEAAESHRASLRFGERNEHQGTISAACSNLAVALMTLGELKEARELLRRAIEINERRGALRRVVLHRVNLSNVMGRLGETSEARQLLENILKDALSANDGVIIRKVAGNLFSSAVEAKDSVAANKYLNIAQEYSKGAVDDAGNARLLHTFSGLLLQTDTPEAAERICQEAMDIYRRIDDPPGVAGAFMSLSAIYEAEGKYERATDAATKAFELFKELRDLHGIAASLSNLGILKRRAGRVSEAASLVRQGVTIFDTLDNQRTVADLSVQLGMLYLELGDRQRARDTWQEALRIFVDRGDSDQAKGVRSLLDDF